MLFVFCAANEIFFLAIYLLSFPEFAESHKWPWVVAIATSPICVAKQYINVLQMVKAAVRLAEADVELRRKAME